MRELYNAFPGGLRGTPHASRRFPTARAQDVPLRRQSSNWRSGREAETCRDLGKRRLFGVADSHAAEPEKSSFCRGLGNRLADMLKPALEGRSVRRSLRAT